MNKYVTVVVFRKLHHAQIIQSKLANEGFTAILPNESINQAFNFITDSFNHTLSNRGHQLINTPSRIDIELFLEASQNTYHPSENPNGTFLLNMAENGLSSPLIKSKFEEIISKEIIPDWVMKYTHPLGHPDVRETIAHFMQTYFGSNKINAENIVFSAGATASLEVCTFGLADPGDLVVIPAPAYPMYTNDLGIKNQIERYDLHTHYEIGDQASLALIDIAILDKTLENINAINKKFKILLLTTPDNPSGSKYSAAQLSSIAKWCVKHQIHLIVNEIYALSTINIDNDLIKDDYDQDIQFESFAKIMASENSDFLHLIYGLSKDFSISGMRFGIIHTLNNDLLTAMGNINVPNMVSNMTQWVVGKLFDDISFIKEHISTNQALITQSYLTTLKVLKALDISYIPSRGSLFIWADFSKFMNDNTFDHEMKLWKNIYDNTGVLLTPGGGFQHEKYGLFRVVHTALPLDYLKTGLNKMKDYLLQ